MKYVSGEILTVKGFITGYLGFHNNQILDIGYRNPPEKPICKGLIIPKLVNIHTHIGDSFVKGKNIELPKNIDKLVAPPNGLKHKLLKNASDEEIINGMKNSIYKMIKNGTSLFCDFRENGIKGINLLKTAVNNCNISSVILSRPNDLDFNENEIKLLLENSDGFGISGISDWDFSKLEKISKFAKKKGKIFAIHASEHTREDINLILDLKPDFLVHMLQANESDLSLVKENDIPIVICPRSNFFFRLRPNVTLMKKIGVNILIGTDNAMLNSPNIIEEILFIRKKFSELTVKELLYKVCFEARKALNLSHSILGPNSKADFIVLEGKSLKPLYISVY
jgi:cytosine/adenosine deaminase-related metal-dependent hydrolase